MDNFQLSELAQKAKDGDMAAFEKLYIELSPEIYAIACEITQNKEESRDLVQDCFLAAMENIATLKEPDKIKNWLIRIAANKSRDYIKKKKPSALTEDQYEIIENIEEDDIAVIPEKSLETDERIEDVNEMLNSLTEDKRLCLLLRFKYDMSYAEIAQELGITESAVKSRISRAKDDIEKEAEKRKKKGLPLFGVAPFGLVIFAIKKSADITASSFAGSAAQTAAFAGISAASQAGIAVSSAAATTVASATASAASTTATAATGIGAKVAAMSVAQKVVAGVAAATIATGSATVTTVVVKNKIEANTTTAYVEEVTTAPDYGFESETVFIPSVTETSVSESSTTQNSTSSENQSSTVTQIKETEKSTVANKTTTQKQTATKKSTTTKAVTTTKVTTTQKPTTTKKETTTKPTTTEEATTTKAITTTTVKASTTTTTAKATTTTTKATTTTTEAASPATVTVKVYSAGSGSEYKTYNLTFDSGVTLSDSDIETGLMNQHGIDAMADSFSVTTEPGGNYTATAYEI